MKYLCILLLICSMVTVGRAVLIDDFEDGDVSDYTKVIMLDTNNTSVRNVSTLQAVGGQWQVTTTTCTAIEQTAYIKAGYLLNVGDELQFDYTDNGGNRAGGIFVGVMPSEDVRADYLTVYCENTTSVFSRGFSNGGELTPYTFTMPTAGYDTLFIKRYGTNDFEVGYYYEGSRYVLTERIDMSFGDAGEEIVVGLYTDIRDTGTIGVGDNLAIISDSPPPTIVNDPNDVSVTEIQQASFETVFTSDSTPSVAWYKVDASGDVFMDTAESNIDVQTAYDSGSEQYTTTLTLTGLATTDSGQYYSRITNDAGSVDSNTADLLVYGLVAYWTLDQSRYADSNYLEDISGYNAAAMGTPTFVTGVDGAANGAVQMSTSDGWALCPVFDPVQQSGQMSVSFWANWGQTPATEEDLVAASTDDEILTMSNGLKADGQWQHVCIVLDGTNGKLYVDGVLQDETVWQLPAQTDAAINIGIDINQQNPFNGAMDDVRLYNYALTNIEVADLRYALSGNSSCILDFNATYDLSGPQSQPDCVIDLYDLAAFANAWLTSYDLSDFTDMATMWQTSGLYPDGN